MRHTKKRKHSHTSLFSNTQTSTTTEEATIKHPLQKKDRKVSNPKLFPEFKEWTRLDWLKHRHAVSCKKRIDYGMSSLLTKEAVQKPFIKAILEDKPELPPKDAGHSWYYLLNFACAAGSEHSVHYILDQLRRQGGKELSVVLSDNTVLCYAASSGNMSLCQKLMNKPYSCKIDFDVMRYARLSGDLEFMHNFLKCFDEPKFRSPTQSFNG
ncbi:MAG: hypothetical protein JSR33_13860 [Proteobacteria bacterium]|nr:hypothetical protein [Pseudomonadota bacterium]